MIKKIIVFGFIISCAEFGQFAAELVGTYQVNYRNHFEHITLDKKENSVFSSLCPIYNNEGGWFFEGIYSSAYRVIWSLSGDYYNVFSSLRRSQPEGDDFVKLFTNQDGEPEQNSLYHRWYMDTKQELDSVVEDFQSRLPATQNALGLISDALKSIETKNIFLLEKNSFLQSLLSISPEFEGDQRNFCRSAGVVFFLTFVKTIHGYFNFEPIASDLIWKWKKQHEILPYYYPPGWFWETRIKVSSSLTTLVVKEHEKNIEKQICQYLFGIKDKELFDYLEIEDRSKDTIIGVDNYSEIYFCLLNSNSKSRKGWLFYRIYMKLK